MKKNLLARFILVLILVEGIVLLRQEYQTRPALYAWTQAHVFGSPYWQSQLDQNFFVDSRQTFANCKKQMDYEREYGGTNALHNLVELQQVCNITVERYNSALASHLQGSQYAGIFEASRVESFRIGKIKNPPSPLMRF